MTDTAHIVEEQAARASDSDHYTMRISRQTVDKLGVKLYDRVSAVVAELIANAYDADAEDVTVKLPLACLLGADSAPDPESADAYVIEVMDDGHGMTPEEADEHFLTVGRDRRRHPEQGAMSRLKERRVMGRKGIGKLAPFGICSRIEVISSGGARRAHGFLTSHFILDYDEILEDTEEDYYPDRGDLDRTHRETAGTTIRLSHFRRKRVPDRETFLRQLARRFGGEQPDFRIVVEDTRSPEDEPVRVEPIDIPIVESTRIELSNRPVVTDDEVELPVQGWVGLAKQAYKHEELAGVRIYARNKIVATTRDFELMSGFTGEQTLRSYLVGEIHAEWLDDDDGDDLIQTDRQDILWESEYGRAFRSWGAELLKKVGELSRKPRREIVRKRFLEVADFERRAREAYADERVVEVALELADQIGGFAAEDELEDREYVDGLAEIILSVAPHRALIEALQEFGEKVGFEDTTMETLLDLFDKTRIAEMASYSQIAAERVQVVEKLTGRIDDRADEQQLQELIAAAPWLIEPTWSVITMNQALKTFADRFAAFWRDRYKEEITIAIDHHTKRPDFTAIQIGSMLHIVELKRPGRAFGTADFNRLQTYVLAFRAFFDHHAEISRSFPEGWRIELIADEMGLTDATQKEAFARFVSRNEVRSSTWYDFLLRVRKANEEFLEISDAARRVSEELEVGATRTAASASAS